MLAITDQFEQGLTESVKQAREALSRITDEYQRAYSRRDHLRAPGQGAARTRRGPAPPRWPTSYSARQDWYEKAEALRPAGNDDVLLRWNACARLLMRHPRAMSATAASVPAVFRRLRPSTVPAPGSPAQNRTT